MLSDNTRLIIVIVLEGGFVGMDYAVSIVSVIQFFFVIVIGMYFWNLLRSQQGNRGAVERESKKEIEKLYSPSFIVEHPATSLKDYSLYIRQRETAEQESTLTRSNQIGQVNETIADETAKIMSDYSSGVISEQQKNLLLKSV